MIILFKFCDINWLLLSLIPFLLGLLLGWLLWARYKKYEAMYGKSQKEVKKLKGRVAELESELEACRKKGSELDGQLAIANGRMREMTQGATSNTGIAAGSSDNTDLKADLEDCRKRRSELEGDLALAKGRIQELQSSSSEKESQVSNIAAVPIAVAPIAPVTTDSGIATGSDVGSAKPGKYAKLKSDNLQIIEGVGPKMESICKENGIGSWSALAGKTPDQLNEMLGKYGDRYRIIDPETWPKQASFAKDGDWDGLIAYQKGIGGEGESDAKAEKVMIKLGIIKKWKENDLKAVEGIGPKIAELLNNAGITTWRELANTDVSKIQSVLDAAGSRYKLADPGTWPKQAGLAADGLWDELEALQDELDGGK